MNKKAGIYIVFWIAALFVSLCGSTAFAQDTANRYSIFFGWKTEGAHELLARQAAAFGQLKDTRGLAVSFGALLGPTVIVQQDSADQFLRAAREGGLDYVIPSAPEFMFGVEALKRFDDADDYPRFISANIVDAKTRKPLLDPYATWYVSGLRICIVALSDTSALRVSKPENVRGLAMLSYDEALTAASIDVARENADIVMVAGRIDRAAIQDMVKKHPFIDAFITNNQTGGFSGPKGTVSNALVSGKPVYIGPEDPKQLGQISASGRGKNESREFTTITLGDNFPPDPTLLSGLNSTLEEIKKRDTEESVVVKTGAAVTSTLRDIYKADVVFLERQSLYYFPLPDSLTIFNVRNIIKPFDKLTLYELRGSVLKSILKDSGSRLDPDLRLLIAGMTADGKVDSIPVGEETLYTVLTTTHLRSGGNGYSQFRSGTGERLNNVNMLAAVEAFLVEKDKRIRRLTRPKNYTVLLNFSIGSNLNKTQVDKDRDAYGGAVPGQLRNLKDQFFGNLRLGSEGNRFTYKHRRHSMALSVDMAFQRTGTKDDKGDVQYRKTQDYLKVTNKYEYDRVTFGSKPYVEIVGNSYLHPGPGKHPINASMTTGLSKKFPKVWLSTQAGLNGTRDYFSNRSTLGTNVAFQFDKTFPAKSFLTSPLVFFSRTDLFWNPYEQAHYEFRHESNNRLTFQLMKKLNLVFNARTYSYRSNVLRRTAFGVVYDLTLNYAVQWKH